MSAPDAGAAAAPDAAADVAPLARLGGRVRLVRAPNPSPMTLEGTNTWLFAPVGAGARGAAVVDPGPEDAGHRTAVLEAAAPWGGVALVLLTHGHPDHAEGAPALAAAAGAPLRSATSAAPLADGERLGAWGLVALAVPGHTTDSVALLLAPAGGAGGEPPLAVASGDVVLGRGSSVVAAPDGDLGAHLASLERLAAVAAGAVLLPGHGPVRPDAGAVAAEQLEHRRRRLEQVRSALAAGDTTAEEVVDRLYPELDPRRDARLRAAAEATTRAALAHLRTVG